MTARRSLLCLLLLLFATMSTSAQPSFNREITELARQLNLWRINLGLGPLIYSPTLERMAASQADFVLTLSSYPDDIHVGAQGEDPRARSQFPEFAWPTYGHPEIISVTEITAIGSIASAIDYWHHSDIHNRSVINPAFREVGIAARQYGTDIMFVVVLGGEPNVLPILIDAENNDIYMTNEYARWSGSWIGVVTEYRYLDEDEQPLTDWTPWERIVEVPEGLESEPVFIQYRDADDKRAKWEIVYDPVWSSIPPPADLVITPPQVTPTLEITEGGPTATLTSTPASMFVTNTPVPSPTPTPNVPTRTPFPTLTLTPTPIPGQIVLFYNDNVFTLYNNGADYIDMTGISFRREDVGFVGTFWEEVEPELNLSALPPTQCLVIEPETGLTYNAPPQCSQVRSIVQEPNPRYFWLEDFEVFINGELVATCDGEADSCSIDLN